MPDPPPVTTATCPSRSPAISLLLFLRPHSACTCCTSRHVMLWSERAYASLWLRPWTHRRPQFLVGTRHAQHADIVEAMPDDLQSDRQTIRIVAGTDRARRLLRHVERRREADVLERLCGIVARRRFIDGICGDR